ncbi:G-type lectin S-receptor-like serine/threonine-protein kinase At4g27290 [Juglans regia]|uniref:G-type lectin S-receptor-like serine/threonine-protein kinase At4g27290 n=1 Tax=Juglans regia TaxID=51240 RepID=A0A6P9EFS3_JUGRE|nr:G-type lectin S-receptor-like serine/threonine-protein kinase At4g27290 [Juglans regia]
MVTDEGVLALLNRTNNIVWSSNSSRRSENPVAQLLDNGNLVVKDGNVDDPNKFLWRSFDYPCDTFLPEMKIGRNFVTGIDRILSSWKSAEDPPQGQFSLRIDPHRFPQLVVLNGTRIKARAGPWNGLQFTGYPFTRHNSGVQAKFVLNENEVYYEITLGNSSALTRLVVNPSGSGQRFIWADQTRSWKLFFTPTEADQCENYALCGAFSTCNPSNSNVCACLEGFIPKSRKYSVRKGHP